MPLREKWIIIGDSITDAGRTDGLIPWGNGYAAYFFRWLTAEYSHLDFECHNQGICGNTIRGLTYRWQDDIISLKPNYLIVYIGVNDAHLALESPDSIANQVDIFQKKYLALLEKAQEYSAPKMVLITPFYCHPNQSLPIFQAVSLYAEAVRKLAAKTKSELLDLQKIFADKAQNESDFRKWSQDSVHPTDLGHRLISEKLQAIVNKFLAQ